MEKTWFNDTVTRRLPSIFCHRICTCISAKQIQLLTAAAKVARENKNRKSKLTLKNVSTNWLLLLDLRVHYKNETVMKLTFLFGKTCYNIKVCATKWVANKTVIVQIVQISFLLLLVIVATTASEQNATLLVYYIRLQITSFSRHPTTVFMSKALACLLLPGPVLISNPHPSCTRPLLNTLIGLISSF